MTRTVDQIRETWSKVPRWQFGDIEDTAICDLSGLVIHRPVYDRTDQFEICHLSAIVLAPTDIAILLEEIRRLRAALKPLADTWIRTETVGEIESRIIEVTGDGPFAGWIAELLTTHAKAARTALEPTP